MKLENKLVDLRVALDVKMCGFLGSKKVQRRTHQRWIYLGKNCFERVSGHLKTSLTDRLNEHPAQWGRNNQKMHCQVPS